MRLNWRNLKFGATLCAASFIFGCGKDGDDSESKKTATFRDHKVTYESNDLTVSSTSIAGTGMLTFVAPLAEESQSGSHIGLTFELLSDDAEVSLVTFASADLEDGIELKWSKSKSSATVGDKSVDITKALSSMNWDQKVSLRADVHNDEEPSHVVLWHQALTTHVDEDNEIYNSEEESSDFPGQGKGTFAGLILKNANVTELLITEPQEEHHD